jgi:ParB-like chromosome segregation protein Spo0J
MNKTESIKQQVSSLILNSTLDEKVEIINELREHIHLLSPFSKEPVDYVRWVKCEDVTSNDYNPNKVAPPEMELLEISIINDGYTQPIVAWQNEEKGKVEVIDGFHRNRVGKESKLVNQRINGYLPTVIIRKEQQGKNDRIASTIRHNRARGKHQIDAMSEIILELKNRNWKNERIARELGMDEEEILRLCQITGLEDLFKDDDFSKAWVAGESNDEFIPLSNDITDEELEVRTTNTSDPERIFHTFDKWECHKAGFYASKKDGLTHEQCEMEYYNVLSNLETFENGLTKVILEWKNSCEHYLTNKAMNRIAWLGQASVCILTGVPSKYSSGWSLLNSEQQDAANSLALKYLNYWFKENNRQEITLEEALSVGRQVNIY